MSAPFIGIFVAGMVWVGVVLAANGDITINNSHIRNSAVVSGDGPNVVIKNSSSGKSVSVNSSGSSGSIYINGISIVTSNGDVDMVVPSSIKRIRVKQADGTWVTVYPVKGK